VKTILTKAKFLQTMITHAPKCVKGLTVLVFQKDIISHFVMANIKNCCFIKNVAHVMKFCGCGKNSLAKWAIFLKTGLKYTSNMYGKEV